MNAAERGITAHYQVELYERMVKVAADNGVSADRAAKLIEAHVMRAMMTRWWERRGYKMPALATRQPGADSPATDLTSPEPT